MLTFAVESKHKQLFKTRNNNDEYDGKLLVVALETTIVARH